MRVGYCRISKKSQKLTAQVEALRRVNCDHIVKERISGKSEIRSVLEKTVAPLKRGDTLIVWKIDRLGRNFFQLVELEHRLTRRGVKIISVVESIDTSTAHGRMAYRFLAIFADEEHAGMVTRTIAGVASARAKGKNPGRRPKLTPAQIVEANALLAGNASADEVAKRYGVDRSTVYRHKSKRGTVGHGSR